MKKMTEYRPVLVLVASLVLVTPMIWTNGAHLDTGMTIATVSLIAISAGLAYGEAGILTVAQAAFAAIGAYVTAISTTHFGWPTGLGLLAAIIIPACIAFPLALMIIRLSALALALATVMISSITYQLLSAGGEFTGGFIGIGGIAPLPFAGPLQTYLFAWVLVVIVVIAMIHLRHSTQGRALRVIQSDSLLAQSLGIPVTRRLAAVFALSAAIAGLAGWLYAHTRGYLAPESLPLNLSISVLVMAIVGGKKSALGPVLGATLLTLVFEFIPSAQAQGMFYGALLVFVLLFFPGGILGVNWSGVRWNQNLRNRLRRSAKPVHSGVVQDERPEARQQRLTQQRGDSAHDFIR